MKITLLGEFSGFHTTLRDGLTALGHEAIVVGTGDGSKAIPVDWDIGSQHTGTIGTLERVVKGLLFSARTSKSDLVQVINPYVFPRGSGLNNKLLRLLRGRVPKMFLSACGDDAFFVQKGIAQMRYNPIDEATRYDLCLPQHPLDSSEDARWNAELASMVNGIIPVMHEYELGYARLANVLATIPLPINTDSIEALPNIVDDRIVVLHGAGRAGFKGSRHILEAFSIIKERHPSKFEFIYVTDLPIGKYLDLMRRVNVIVDQAYSYSCGMNALLGLAMGKIVLGGAEPESLSIYDGEPSPVHNILPDSQDIVEKLEALLDVSPQFSAMGELGRHFVERHHDYRDIASRYVNAWSSC